MSRQVRFWLKWTRLILTQAGWQLRAVERAANAVRVSDAQLLEVKAAPKPLPPNALPGYRHAVCQSGNAGCQATRKMQHCRWMLQTQHWPQPGTMTKARADAIGEQIAQADTSYQPVDGIVTARLLEPSATAVPGQTIVQVIDPASLWVKARIDQ